MLGGLGSGMFGTGMKAARVGDQIDAQVQGAKALVLNAKTTAQQFDFVESQLQQFAQILGQADPMSAMQFQNLQQQINNIQTQIVNSLNQVEGALTQIDNLTNAIQN